MAKKRSTTDQQVADLLRTAKDALNLSVAFLTRMDGTTQHLEVVESSVPFLFREGAGQFSFPGFECLARPCIDHVEGNTREYFCGKPEGSERFIR